MDKKFLKVVGVSAALCASTLLSSATLADEGRLYVAPGFQWMDFDSDRMTDDDLGYNLGVGFGLTDKISLEAVYTRIDFDDMPGISVDRLDSARLDVLYALDNSVGSFSPFLVSGLGHSDVEDEHDTTLNVGAGLKYRFNDRVEWRSSARTFYGFDDKTYDFGIDTGLVFHLGESRSQSRVEPSPMPEPAPERDSDQDGVPDSRDACPNTPRNYAVDERGCPIIEEEVARITLDVEFEFDRSEVRPQYFQEIRQVADFLSEHDDVVAVLEGHTDSVGTEAYNQELSERRATAVRQVLIERFDVNAARITARGYGESRPIASNDTPEGRAENRRVESAMSVTVQRPRMR